MFEQKRAYWRSLDNAAKLFSAASSPKDTRVFRFYCELKEEVEEKKIKEPSECKQLLINEIKDQMRVDSNRV